MSIQRARFVAEIVEHRGALYARDLWRDAEPIPIEGHGLDAGAFVEVRAEGGRARPVEGGLLASRGSAMASLVRVAAEHGLDPTFPPEVLRETEETLAAPGIDDPTLVDLVDLPFVTIDNEGSRDLDQALHIEADGDGHRVRYAIADAAHFVRPGTALFAEALARGATFYLPGWSIPMLPRALSEGLVSLNPVVPRRALVFDMRLDRDGLCVETRIVRARIVSRGKLTYEGVQRFLDAPETHAFAREPFAASLLALREVGERRIADAAARDVVQHRRESIEIGLGDRRSFVVLGGLRNDVERYNEQLSLLCNVEGARILREADGAHAQPIYRVHPAPSGERVRSLAGTIERLVRLHAMEDPRWRWRRDEGQSLAAYLRGLPDTGHLARAIERQAILANVRSTFSGEAAAHHGVGAEVYARFSAPMREIVGVFLHKELCEHLTERSPDPTLDDALRERVIEAANRARTVQGRIESIAQRLALDAVFERDLAMAERPRRRGTVLGLTHAKLYLLLEDPPLEVQLHVADLERSITERSGVTVGRHLPPFAGVGMPSCSGATQQVGRELALGEGELSLEQPDGSALARVGEALDVVVERRDPRSGRWVFRVVA